MRKNKSGIFDRFKKKQKQQEMYGRSTDFFPKPLELLHGKNTPNERTDNVYFHGLIYIDGKQLKVVTLEVGDQMGRTHITSNQYTVEVKQECYLVRRIVKIDILK